MQPLSDALRERVLAQHESKLKTLDAAPSFDPERVAALRGQIALSCSFCRDTLERESSVYCAGCLAPHHAECFAEHGRCTMPGCEETRAVQPAVLEAPHRRHERRWRLRLAAPLVALAVGGGIAALTTAEPDLVAEGRRAREGGSTFADSDVVVVEDAPLRSRPRASTRRFPPEAWR